jgi:hypothetical protein
MEKSRGSGAALLDPLKRKRLFRSRTGDVPIATIFQLILHNAGKVVPILIIGINYLRQ